MPAQSPRRSEANVVYPTLPTGIALGEGYLAGAVGFITLPKSAGSMVDLASFYLRQSVNVAKPRQRMPLAVGCTGRVDPDVEQPPHAKPDMGESVVWIVAGAGGRARDDRVATRSTIITGQLPVEHWDEYLADPSPA